MRTIETQDRVAGRAGTDLSLTDTGEFVFEPVIQISVPAQGPIRTEATGHSWGGSRTVAHTEYQEHTITQGERFTDGEDWRTAVTTDTAHSADLWFTYKVRNRGQDFAHEIADLAFNIYIGDDPNPAITYFPAVDIGGDGKLHDFRPGEEHTYTSARVPLSLEQMKAIDTGGPLYVVLESYSYGMDKYFYEDAYSSGVLFAIEDGIGDGDELIDTYLIPSWGSLTAQDALKHYFPVEEDMDGNLLAIWTPKRVSGTPS